MQTDLTPAQLQETVLGCLADNYGLKGSLKRLGGENLNYLVTTEEGAHYVFKIVDDDMPPEVVEMESHAIEHASAASVPLKFPKIDNNHFGKIESGIKIHKNIVYRARLLDFVDGTPIDSTSDISDDLLKNIGKSLASFDIAMQDFDHPAAHRSHRWDLTGAGRHRDKISLLDDPDQQELLQWAFETWELQAAGHFADLPRQFIHGDANRENFLVGGNEVIGLVDFGDCCINPTVCELAICLAYIMMGQEDPIRGAEIVSDAYQELRPLSDLEQSVVYPLVCGRLAVTISVAAARRRLDPNNPNWFGDDKLAWGLLPLLREFI